MSPKLSLTLPYPPQECRLADLSRVLPDGLPGGFKLGETVFYLGEDDQWDDGDSISYGEKGEVTGSVVEDAHVDPPEFLLVVACSRGQNTHLSGHAAARAPGHPPPWKPAALRGAALLPGPREERPHGVGAGEKLRGALVPAQEVAGPPTALPWAHAGLPAHA